jgi:polar amino acid transport system substrate-binding protein
MKVFFIILSSIFVVTVCHLYASDLRFGGELGYFPFEIQGENGSATGFFADVWKLAGEKAGFSVDYSLEPLRVLMESLESGNFDVIGGIFFSEERAQRYLFTSPFYEISTSIYYRSSVSITDGLKDIEKYKVGVVDGDYSITYLRSRMVPGDFVTYATAQELVYAAVSGEISVFICDDPVATYWLNHYGKTREYKSTNPIYRNMVYGAVRKGREDLLVLLNRGLGLVSAEELKSLENKWFGYQVQSIFPWTFVSTAGWVSVLVLSLVFFWNFRLRKKVEETAVIIKEQNIQLAGKNIALTAQESQLTAMNEQLKAYSEEINASLQEVRALNQTLNDLIELSKLLSEAARGKDRLFFEKMLKTTLALVPKADYGSVSVFRQDEWRFVYAIGHDLENLETLRLKKNDFPLEGKIALIDNLVSDKTLRIGSENLEKLSSAIKPLAHSIIIGLFISDMLIGGITIDIAAESKKRFTFQDMNIAQAFSNIASAFLAVQRYTISQGKFQKDLIMSMIKVLEIYDPYTRGHSENVASLSAQLAEYIRLPSETIQRIYWAGLVHDIGKILVSPVVLSKTEPLTSEEYGLLQKHPVWGAEVLQTSEELEDIVRYVRHHHERWDGKGYPDRLESDEIPYVSRIIALADSFDAMTSERPYRKKKTIEEALQDIQHEAGKQFDPELAVRFADMITRRIAGGIQE